MITLGLLKSMVKVSARSKILLDISSESHSKVKRYNFHKARKNWLCASYVILQVAPTCALIQTMLLTKNHTEEQPQKTKTSESDKRKLKYKHTEIHLTLKVTTENNVQKEGM